MRKLLTFNNQKHKRVQLSSFYPYPLNNNFYSNPVHLNLTLYRPLPEDS